MNSRPRPARPGLWSKISRGRRLVGGAVLVATVGLLATGCAASGGGSAGTGSAGAPAGKVKIVMSNNFMANEWRPQMVNLAKYIAGQDKYKNTLDFSVVIADSTPQAQISSLQSIIRGKPDAIIIDASSATALNPTIQQACDAGITVMTFDQTATAPCAPRLGEDYTAAATDMINWMAAQLGGSGNILIDKGLAGVPLSADMQAAWEKSVQTTYPNIKIVGSYNSNFSAAAEQQAILSALSQYPSVDGVLSQDSCTAVLAAAKKAGRTFKGVGCNAYNRDALQCETDKLACWMYAAPANVGALAMERAYAVVHDHAKQADFENAAAANFVSTTGSTATYQHAQPVDALASGKNYYPDQAGALVIPLNYGSWTIPPSAALSGL